ncbi:hypothetical protein PAAG_11215 [Paracoccidioides lutzii Pb01]|uniref:Uncharacterized protein n=1 Tax=Paracoccidioides lutzii (strain ATCC MYA-826 / Pb01) TaxID=502779 RepID=A0A0A2VMG5_PARBA|nr:hypothetical protein PAAG_11215 [Paracoccidioides lutzii Pb01]KGQ02039.1 hypothetical protein PAAG_11215 [Paracoccidioides lutzii Pb01]
MARGRVDGIPKLNHFRNCSVHIYPDIRGQRKDNGVRARRGDVGEADKEAKIRSYASSVPTTEDTPRQHKASRIERSIQASQARKARPRSVQTAKQRRTAAAD